MRNEFKDAPETGRGGSILPEKPKTFQSHHTNPPAGAGDDASRSEKPRGPEHHPELPPETAGARAGRKETPVTNLRAPELPASGPGADACPGEKPTRPKHQRNLPPQGGAEGPKPLGDQETEAFRETSPGDGGGDAPLRKSEPVGASASPTKSRRKAGKIDGDHASPETRFHGETVDLRFTDPLIAEIVQLHRMRRRWMKAKNALILQGKAFGRAVCDGDKEAGSAAFDRVAKGKAQEGDEALTVALGPFIAAIARFDEDIRPIERHLEKLAKKLPIAPWVQSVTGLGFGSVAAIVGEAGDLSAYPSVAGVWKRMGLAVIDGDGRQRKVASAESALAHGYNPERRSIVWVMADSMSKLQRTWLDKETGEVKKPAGTYGSILEAEKEKALAAGLSKAHAEARGKRHMSKAVLRDMTAEWRRAVGLLERENHMDPADRPLFLEAAE